MIYLKAESKQFGEFVFPVASGLFGLNETKHFNVSLPLVPYQEDNGCNAPNYSYQGLAVMVPRGYCPFQTKSINLAKSGASLVLISDNVPEDSFVMSTDKNADHRLPNIPVALVGWNDSRRLYRWLKHDYYVSLSLYNP